MNNQNLISIFITIKIFNDVFGHRLVNNLHKSYNSKTIFSLANCSHELFFKDFASRILRQLESIETELKLIYHVCATGKQFTLNTFSITIEKLLL
jgi:hypothetical protein